MADEEVEASQIAEALETSICVLLVKRLADVGGSSFEQAMATTEDMGTVSALADRAAGLLEAATWREVETAAGEGLEAIGAAATAHGSAVSSEAVAAATEAAKKEVASVYEPLHAAKDVYLVQSDGTYSDITTTWRKMQGAAAASKGTTAEDWMQSYTSVLAKKGVGIKVGDSGIREIAGEVRRATLESKFARSDDIMRAAAGSAGMDGVQISAHTCCATDHLPYQGRVYSKTKFELLNSSLSRPIGRGVMNCRHSLLYCYSDSKSMYSASELAAFEKGSTGLVEFTGRSGQTLTRTAYEATQYLRSSEVSIRKLKQARYIASAAGVDASGLDSQIDSATAAYRQLCGELGETFTESRIAAYTMGDLQSS